MRFWFSWLRLQLQRLRLPLADAITLVGTIALAIWTLGTVTQRCGGIALPLDDAYIHFGYARSFAQLTPFVYSPGAPPSAGSTSMLWPLVLAPFQAVLGTASSVLSWVAVCLGFASLWGLCCETRRLAEYFLDEVLASGIGILPLAFAAHTWFAASGMEVMPLAWLLCHSCRKTLQYQGDLPQLRRLLLLAALCPLLRPEGALLSIWIGLVLWLRPGGRPRHLAGFAFACVTLPPALTWLFTGELTPTTAVAKWLPLSPYLAEHTLELTLDNLQILFWTLFNGEGWTPMFLPTGYAAISWAALAAVAASLVPARTRFAACALLFVGAGILLPASYETFLVNRLRYIWPFVTPWLIGLGLLAQSAGWLASSAGAWASRPWVRASSAADAKVARRTAVAGRATRHGVLVLFIFGLAAKLPESIDDLAHSAHAIDSQQVSLAHWVRRELPSDAMLGVNDAGALAYFGGHRTFDLVGLTTAGEAPHWRAGAGSRFEHYERLGAARLPTHFVVYPQWLQADLLLGALLQERYVESTILGAPLMRVHRANYEFLGSAELPWSDLDRADRPLRIVDELDVADLESERAHEYLLLPSSAMDNRIFISGARADGGRSGRTREQFRLRFEGKCSLVLRVQFAPAESPRTHGAPAMTLEVQVGETSPLRVVASSDGSWTEPTVRPPPEMCRGEQRVRVTSQNEEPFSALHYWSIAD